MTPTETAAYRWLQATGYRESDITFQYTGNPDFVTADGAGWEVKRLTRSSTVFGVRQIADLRQRTGTTTVLFWQPGNDAPELTADFAELPMPGRWSGITIGVTWQPRFDFPRVVRTSEAVDALVAKCIAVGPRKAFVASAVVA